MTRRRRDHSLALYLYTAATIIGGLLAFAWTAVTFEIDPTISLTASGGSEGILLGLLFWIAIGLLGSLRVERLHGHGVLTFHFPFIIAATALGGPTAGALVALISTLERRELRLLEVPWYGTLANHAAYTIAAIAGGVTMVGIRGAMADAAPTGAPSVELVAIVIGSLVLAVTATAFAVGTVVLRDGLGVREAIRLFDMGFRTTSAAEVVLGWMLWLTYSTVGWWASAICILLVLVVWNGHDAVEIAKHDAMTGLLTRAAFDARLDEARLAARTRGRRSALLAIDLDGFKQINDIHGHAVGDAVLREVGSRLRQSTRLTDAAVRRGGDEFGVLLTDLADAAMAERLAWRIHAAICAPIELDETDVSVGASIGVVVIDPDRLVPPSGRLHDLTDRLMYQVKRRGGGVRLDDRHAPEVASEPATRDDDAA